MRLVSLQGGEGPCLVFRGVQGDRGVREDRGGFLGQVVPWPGGALAIQSSTLSLLWSVMTAANLDGVQ